VFAEAYRRLLPLDWKLTIKRTELRRKMEEARKLFEKNQLKRESNDLKACKGTNIYKIYSSKTIQEHFNISESCTPAGIKATFRQLTLIYHPDKVKAEEKECATIIYREITNARDTFLSKCK
jgi:hypothetical protein